VEKQHGAIVMPIAGRTRNVCCSLFG